MSTSKRHSTVWVEAVPVDETRDGDGTQKCLRVRGYAILFNSESERMGSVVETIDPRSLDHLGELNSLDVRFQEEHKDTALARTINGTLRLSKDSRGVMMEADLDPRSTRAKDLYYAIERGDISKMSFGFSIAPGGENLTEREDGTLRAHVTKIGMLYEVSSVNFPAYRETSIGADPADDLEPEDDPVERSWDPELVRRMHLDV